MECVGAMRSHDCRALFLRGRRRCFGRTAWSVVPYFESCPWEDVRMTRPDDAAEAMPRRLFALAVVIILLLGAGRILADQDDVPKRTGEQEVRFNEGVLAYA